VTRSAPSRSSESAQACVGVSQREVHCLVRSALVLLGCLWSSVSCSRTKHSDVRYDVVIQNGTIIDGTGAPRQRLDIALRGDRIVQIAPRIDGSNAAAIVDATGLIVAPGFIEPHAHISDIALHPDAANFTTQGITTIVASLHSMDQPYPLGAFLDTLHVAPNTLWTAGHTWMRKRLMGLADRAPSPDELRGMTELAKEAMLDGAIGLGTGLEYVPATFAQTNELVALATVTARPHSLYVTHLRDEGAALYPAINEAISVASASKQPLHISHLKSTGAENWGRAKTVLSVLDSATSSGTHTSFDVYPYVAYSTYSDVLFPAWALAGGNAAFKLRVADPAIRSRIVTEMRTLFRAQTGNTLESVQFREHPTNPQLNGKTLSDHLVAEGKPLTLDAGFNALMTLQASGAFIGIFYGMSNADVDLFLLHPSAMISSDGDLVTPGVGFPHPRSYGAFPRVLSHYVRDRQLLSLEAALHKMTGLPAAVFGIAQRGTLRNGNFADVVLFDAARVQDDATFTDPHHYARGIQHLYINGRAVIASGSRTGAKAGVPIRRMQ
jgi:N-acyl-D-amino-acid deacylase